MDSRSKFGEWLRQRRKLLDLTQAELADLSDCSVITIRKLEAGERKPSPQLAQSLAEPLHIPIREMHAFVQFARSDDLGGAFHLPPWEEESSTWRVDQLPDHLDNVLVNESSPSVETVHFDSFAPEAPQYDQLPNGHSLFRQTARGPIHGDIEGTMELRLTQIVVPKPAGMDYTKTLPMNFTAIFVIQSGEEKIEGYYEGTMTPQLNKVGSGSAYVLATGQVLSVSPAYADLYQNYVFTEYVVKLVEGVSTGASGKMQFKTTL